MEHMQIAVAQDRFREFPFLANENANFDQHSGSRRELTCADFITSAVGFESLEKF
jgi:hypothetical protein